MGLVADEHGQRPETLEERARVAQVAFAVLDASEHTRIGRRKARDDIVGDRDAGYLRDVIEIEAKTRIGDAIDEPRVTRIDALFTGALEEEWRQYEGAGASGTHRMSREFDGVRECGATRTCDNPSRRYAGGKQPSSPCDVVPPKGLSSPVVPKGAMPSTPAANKRWAWDASIRTSGAPDASSGVSVAHQTPRIRSAKMLSVGCNHDQLCKAQ
jgi:hypothetical protein